MDRGAIAQSHRYYTVNHQMTATPDILTGNYLRSEMRQAPPKELMESLGMPMPELQQEIEKEGLERA